MNLSRAKPANTAGPSAGPQQKKQRKLELETFVEKRDYSGAIALLEVRLITDTDTHAHQCLLRV